MCDTCGIGPELTGSGISIFGKNSDREADETQLIKSVPAQNYPANAVLQCTYIAIPQAGSTYAMVISKPFWLWGAEMGVNEKGVVIGNEALFTRVKPEKTPGLIGMDLLRLGLERGASAEEAAQIIIELLKRYGQAGACGYRDKKFNYMNSFIIMDRRGILKLETAGRDYALQRLSGYAVISNGITIAKDWDFSSLATGTDFSKFSDPLITYFAGSPFRRNRNQASILKAKGAICAADVFAMLRDHFASQPATGFNRDVCMHASDPLIRKSQTTGSLVVELHPDERFRIFVTGGSAPCLTAFKPFLPAAPFRDLGVGAGCYSDQSYWWRHEAYHINAVLRYDTVQPLVQKYIQDGESSSTKNLPAHLWESAEPDLRKISQDAFRESEDREKAMLERMKDIKKTSSLLASCFWSRMARRSGVPLI
ncbi:MAG: peptidase U34 [Deltaproteobacteria bacterium HGW-Deltaproteobacteria-12]|jgi:dipeptidase|nr:MAG: peptidase U34 [Deltaproteobacteria bacterium HGW-Deltaproteobacteria-12]